MNFEKLFEICAKDCLLSTSSPLVIGVSGGADSLCLLDCLSRLGFSLIVAHFDHHLRANSAEDAQLVRDQADRIGAPFFLGEAHVADWAAQHKASIEEAARILRYRFLFDLAEREHAQAVAVGHTADDQVETVLMHLLRGSGGEGLKGMTFSSRAPQWHATLPLARPLLHTWRAETLLYCQENKLPYASDVSNADIIYRRNRIRLELIPFLESYNPQIKSSLWRTADVLAAEQTWMDEMALAAWKECRVDNAPAGQVGLRKMTFQGFAIGLRRRLIRLAVRELRSEVRNLDFEDVERALHFFEQPSRSGQINWTFGLQWMLGALPGKSDPVFWLVDSLRQPPPDYPRWHEETCPLMIPGQVLIENGYTLSFSEESLPDQRQLADASAWEAWLDADTVAQHGLNLRHAHPGDVFQPLGLAGHSQKLSDFWINVKRSRAARQLWPLVCCAEQIAWIPGFRLAHPFRVTGSTRRVIHLKMVPPVLPPGAVPPPSDEVSS